MRVATTILAIIMVFLTASASADGITQKDVEAFYKKVGKLYNKGMLREVSRLYSPDFEFVDSVSGPTPIRYNLVSYFKEAVALQARAERWKLEYEIQSVGIAPDGMTAEVVSVHINTVEGGGKSQTSRSVDRSTIVQSDSGLLFRRVEVLESRLLSGGA